MTKRILDADIEEIKDCILAAMNEFKAKPTTEEKPEFKVYNNEALKQLLGVQDKLIKKYRDDGVLGFSKVGDKFWYTQDDVDQFFKNIHNDPYAFM